MTFGIVFTSIIIISSLSLFLLSSTRMFPMPMRIGIVLLPLGLLWLHVFLYRIPGIENFFSHLLMVLFYFFTFAMLLPMALGFWGIGIIDLPKNSAPEVLGNPKGKKEIAVVYHPGGSPFARTVLLQFAGYFNDTPYKVTLFTASAGLKFDPKLYEAVVLLSPVYAGMIRPALGDFINFHDLAGSKVFIIHTGSGPYNEQEFKYDFGILENRGVKPLDKTKFVMFLPDKNNPAADPKQLPDSIEGFSKTVLAKLK